MSVKICDEHGNEIYEVTTGQSARVYQHGHDTGCHVNDNGDVVSPSGAVIDNIGSGWRNR